MVGVGRGLRRHLEEKMILKKKFLDIEKVLKEFRGKSIRNCAFQKNTTDVATSLKKLSEQRQQDMEPKEQQG
ncbi:hypothetical protein KQX54_017879 [Cotesia glomerata]|uniref:Uncharacterized protein n=1 Tax=Cotesia glomerata TaxID=32391 RepID=A0AAV7IT46_COTGL|nr:hypothetical protein KQX54_017879 [Cotesia glomerata]